MGNRNISFVCRKGTLEILTAVREAPKTFTELKRLINPRTKKPLSPTTLSARLRELTRIQALKRRVIRRDDRASVGYKITPKGLSILRLSTELEEALK